MDILVRFMLQNPDAVMRIRRGLEDLRFVPTTNDELIESMKAEGSLTDERVIEAFRNVDRRVFAPDSEKALAFAQMPLREGKLHLSTPPIYAEAAESLLPLTPGMSFLNIGSGTGYFNCIIAQLLDAEPCTSTNHGIELFPENLAYCRSKVETIPRAATQCEFFQGNIYELDVTHSMRYDRIYIGACVPPKLKFLYGLLEVGGICVGPFQTSTGAQQLRRITRVSPREFRTEVLKTVSFATLVRPPNANHTRNVTYSLPEKPWAIERHATYRKSYRTAVRTTLLAVHCTPSTVPPEEVWTGHIFPYCHRQWFDGVTCDSPSSLSTTDREEESKSSQPSESATDDVSPLARSKQHSIADFSPRPLSHTASEPSSPNRSRAIAYGEQFPTSSATSRSTSVIRNAFVNDSAVGTEESSVSSSDKQDDEFVEVFEDGRRHIIGHEGDPDDLEPGGLLPLDIRHFLELVARERDPNEEASDHMSISEDGEIFDVGNETDPEVTYGGPVEDAG